MTRLEPLKHSVVRRAAACALLLGAVALASCQPVLTTSSFDVAAPGSARFACEDSAGAYALPRHVLSLTVTFTDADPGKTPARYDISPVTEIATADPSQIYCLDFLTSIWSEDKLNITREGDAKLLLGKIETEFDDRSLDIATAIVNAGATAAAAGVRGAVGVKDKKYIVASYQFDPFDYKEIVRVNRALRELDHCVFLDPTGDPLVPVWHGQLCGGNANVRPEHTEYYGMKIISGKPPPKSVSDEGILYRPLLNHKLVVMKRNHDPVGALWQVFETKRVAMTNAAPAFVLEVKRYSFVNAKMNIEFKNGVLSRVQLKKPSEGLAFSEFVLGVAQTIVAIPVRALVIGTTEATNRRDLIKAQADLIAALRSYDRELAKQNRSAIGNASQNGATRAAAIDGVAASRNPEFVACMRNAVLIDNPDPAEYCLALAKGADGQ